jgi:hypothetical protein
VRAVDRSRGLRRLAIEAHTGLTFHLAESQYSRLLKY